MKKINNISEIQQGTEIYDNEGEKHIVLSILDNKIEPIIIVQHFPHSKWFVSNVKCDKCGAMSKFKFTTISLEKHICHNQIEVNGNFYNCGSKKHTEISRRSTGIACKGNILWADFSKNYQLK